MNTIKVFLGCPKRLKYSKIDLKQIFIIRSVAQSGLAHLNGVQGVGGSNPLAPTICY